MKKKVYRRCIVPHCLFGKYNIQRIRKQTGISAKNLFSPPEDPDLFDKWKEVIPGSRVLTSRSFVCEDHFQESDIIRAVVAKRDRGTFYRNTRDTLIKFDAIPCHFNNSKPKVEQNIQSTISNQKLSKTSSGNSISDQVPLIDQVPPFNNQDYYIKQDPMNDQDYFNEQDPFNDQDYFNGQDPLNNKDPLEITQVPGLKEAFPAESYVMIHCKPKSPSKLKLSQESDTERKSTLPTENLNLKEVQTQASSEKTLNTDKNVKLKEIKVVKENVTVQETSGPLKNLNNNVEKINTISQNIDVRKLKTPLNFKNLKTLCRYIRLPNYEWGVACKRDLYVQFMSLRDDRAMRKVRIYKDMSVEILLENSPFKVMGITTPTCERDIHNILRIVEGLNLSNELLDVILKRIPKRDKVNLDSHGKAPSPIPKVTKFSATILSKDGKILNNFITKTLPSNKADGVQRSIRKSIPLAKVTNEKQIPVIVNDRQKNKFSEKEELKRKSEDFEIQVCQSSKNMRVSDNLLNPKSNK